MNDLLNAPSHVNGGDQSTINGRGLPHLKLSDDGLVRLAADMATGQRSFQPSLAQTSTLTGVPVAAIRAEIKARAAEAKNLEADEIQWVVETWERLSGEARQEVVRLISGVV